MDGIISVIMISFSILLSIGLYYSLMKNLKKVEIRLKDFEVVYKFVIPIILSFVGVEYFNNIFL